MASNTHPGGGAPNARGAARLRTQPGRGRRWLRIRLLCDPALVSKVLLVFVRAVSADHRRRARQRGGVSGETGAVTAIQRCGDHLRVLAFLTHPDLTTSILDHLGIRSDVPHLAPARAPPCHAQGDLDVGC